MASLSPEWISPHLSQSTYQPGELWAPGGALWVASCSDILLFGKTAPKQYTSDELLPQICVKNTTHTINFTPL